MSDSFSAGVEPGGLYSHADIKLLICYIIAGVNQSISRKTLLDVISGNGMANFFETSAAIDELVSLHDLNEDADEYLSVTETGRHAAGTLAALLPLTLRERSVKAALQALTRLRRERENHVSIVRKENGYEITCEITDIGTPMLTFTLHVADNLQAQMIKEQFLNNPILLYHNLISVLTGSYRMNEDGSSMTVQLI